MVRIYRVITDKFFPPKLISKILFKFFFIFSLTRSTKQKNNHEIWFRNKKVMNFFLRSDLSKFQATLTLHMIIFMKNKPHHDDKREKLNNICENQPDLRTPVYTALLRLWFFLTFTLNFTKIFYSKKISFVPSVYSQIVKTSNFDLHLVPSTLGWDKITSIFSLEPNSVSTV